MVIHLFINSDIYIFTHLTDWETFFFHLYIYFNWRIVTLQYCHGICHTSVWISHRHTCVPSVLNLPSASFPIPSFQVVRVPALDALHHTSNSHWSSILHMLMYMFQCYSLNLSHPLLSTLCQWVCFLHLGLYFIPANSSTYIFSFPYTPYICVHIRYLFFSFFLYSVWQTLGSSTSVWSDSNLFLFMAEKH